MSQLLMPFVDESESFTNGFECGQIWEILSKGESITDKWIHQENTKQVEMMCRRFMYSCTIEYVSDGWSKLTAISESWKCN